MYLFISIQKNENESKGSALFFGFANPLYVNANYGFSQMMPFVLTIIALVWGSRAATKKRLGAPAALGVPYIRGERGL